MLQDNLEARWEEHPINWMIGGAAEAVKGLREQGKEELEAEAARANDALKNAGNQNFKQVATGSAAGAAVISGVSRVPGIGEPIQALSGFAPNQFMTILFIGPEYKQYTFQWNVSARSPQESEQLRMIVNTFKKAMSPTIKYAVLWGYPCVFRIMFKPNNEQLYKFRPCILKRFQVNYTPLGRAGFYRGVGAPEGMTIQATFLELEYWTQEKMSVTPSRAFDPLSSADF